MHETFFNKEFCFNIMIIRHSFFQKVHSYFFTKLVEYKISLLFMCSLILNKSNFIHTKTQFNSNTSP